MMITSYPLLFLIDSKNDVRLRCMQDDNCMLTVVRPGFGSFYCTMPSVLKFLYICAAPLVLKCFVYLPLVVDLLLAIPDSYRQSGQIACSQSGGVQYLRTHNRRPQALRLKLHKPIIRCSSTLYPELFYTDTRIAFHSVKHIHRLIGNTCNGCSCELAGVGTSRHSYNGTAGMLIPVRSSQPTAGGHEIDPNI